MGTSSYPPQLSWLIYHLIPSPWIPVGLASPAELLAELIQLLGPSYQGWEILFAKIG